MFYVCLATKFGWLMFLSYLCPPAICERDFIWKEGLCTGNQIKIRMGPASNKSGDVVRRGNFGHSGERAIWRQRQRLEGHSCKIKNTKNCWQLLEAKRGKKGFFPRAEVLNFFGTQGWVLWKTVFPWTGLGLGDGLGLIQMHFIYCALSSNDYDISSTSDNQALDPRVWGPPVLKPL